MEDWQIDLLKIGVTAVITGIGGWWAHHTWNKKKQAEYEDTKKRGRLGKGGTADRLSHTEKMTELLIKQKQHGITPEDMMAFEDGVIKKRKRKEAKKQTETPKLQTFTQVFGGVHSIEPPVTPKLESISTGDTDLTRIEAVPPQTTGPNGFPIGFTENGDKVEWIKDEEEDGHVWPMILLRNEDDIHNAIEEFFDKVWWNRHQMWAAQIESGLEDIPDSEVWAKATEAAQRIEAKYGKENLGWNDYDWGMINGKLSALRWVTGSDWDFLDT